MINKWGFLIRKIIKVWYMVLVSFVLLVGASLIDLYIPVINRTIVDNGILGRDYELVAKYILVLLIIYIIRCLFNLLSSIIVAQASAKIRLSLFDEVFDILARLPIKYFKENNITQIYSNINVDINNVSKLFDQTIFMFLTQILYLCGGIYCLLRLSVPMALIVLILIPIKYIGVGFLAKKGRAISEEYIKKSASCAAWFNDIFCGIVDLKIFNLKDKKANKFTYIKKEIVNLERHSAVLSSLKQQFDSLNTQVIILIIYIFGTKLYLKNEMSYGEIMAFLSYIAYVTSPLTYFSNIKFIVANISPSANRLCDFINSTTESETSDSVVKYDINHAVIFEKVTFRYDNKPVIQGFSLNINDKEKIAIVGENGSGKTTILYLLLKLYEDYQGNIIVGSYNIKNLDTDKYRNLFAYAGTDSHLFSGSVKDNIFLEKGQGDINDILNLLKLDLTPDFIIQSNGANISAGQKQKILLARIMVNKNPIVIFDEITANLDYQAIEIFGRVIEEYLSNSTVITITHDKRVEKYMERTAILKYGEIVDEKDKMSGNVLYK